MYGIANISVFNAIMSDQLGQDHTVRSAVRAGLHKVPSLTQVLPEDREFAEDCIRMYRKGQIKKNELKNILFETIGKAQAKHYLESVSLKRSFPNTPLKSKESGVESLRDKLQQAVVKHRFAQGKEAEKEQEALLMQATDIAGAVVRSCWSRIDPRYRDSQRAVIARDYVTQYLLNRWRTPGVDAGRIGGNVRNVLSRDVMRLLAGDVAESEISGLSDWLEKTGFKD